jgi:WD40 repeat protein
MTPVKPESLPHLPGYNVQRILAKGGMGLVVLARQQRLGRLVAIKLPLHTLTGEGRARFLREARAAAGLRHPNICTLHEVGEHHDQPYLVMDYIDGPTLREWVGEQPTARRSAEVVALLARAIAHAHAKGVIHRDLKPGNVLVERTSGQPVLTDFGLAKVLDEAGDQLSQSGTVQGTPAYMSPEQAAGQSSKVGPLSDVYSLGAILYELLTGRAPYVGSVGEILKLVQTEDPQPPRRINPRIHQDLETVCLKAMARDPSQRYPSALELAEDLERFAAGENVRARRAGRFRRTLRWVKRHPIPVASATAGLLALVVTGTLVFLFLGLVRQKQELDDLRAAFDEGLESPEATPAYFERMEGYLAEFQRLAPKQVPELRERMVQRVAGTIRARLEQPRLTPEAEESIRAALLVLADHAPEAAAVLEQQLHDRRSAWNLLFALQAPFTGWQNTFPDALKLQADSLVRSTDAGGQPGEVVRTREECRGSVRLEAVFDPSWGKASGLGLILNHVEAPTDEVLQLVVSPDGQSVVVACGYAGVPRTNVCDLATGQVRTTLPASNPNYAVAFSPDGRRLVTAGPNGSITLREFPSCREIASVAAHSAALRCLAFAPDGRTLVSGGDDANVHLWAVAEDGNALRLRDSIKRGHGNFVISDVAIAPDGQTLATGGGDGTVRIWDLKTRQLLHILKGHTQQVTRIAFNPTADGPILASSSLDGTVRLWRRGTYQEQAALPARSGYAYGVVFSPDGKTVAVPYAGRCVKLWNVATRSERLTLEGFTDRVSSVAFTPDGRSVVTGDVARTIKRWDAITGRETWALEPSAGYAFVLRLPETRPGENKEPQPATLAAALGQGRPLRMQILRDGRLQRERTVLLSPDAPLRLRAAREGDRLVFRVNDLPLLDFQDVFPLGTLRPGVFALEWPAGVGLQQVRAERRQPPASPSLLEQGDEAYARGDFTAAADFYARQIQTGTSEDTAREARYKRALCLLTLKQPEEALPLLRQEAQGVTEDQRNRWGLLAACQLWLHHLKQHQLDQADEVFKLLETHYRFEQLAALISDELRGQILEAYRHGDTALGLIRQDPQRARYLRRVLDVENLFQAPWQERVQSAHFLSKRYLLNGDTDQAVRTVEEVLQNPELPENLVTLPVSDLVLALRERGDSDRALAELNRRLVETRGQYATAVLPLLRLRARLHAARKEWDLAEKDLADFLRQLNPSEWRNGPMQRADAQLIRGFVRDQRGDSEGALQAWREGLKQIRGTPAHVSCEGFLLASLTNDLTEADIAFFIEYSTRNLGIPAATFIRKGGHFDPSWLASVMRNTWRNPRGRDYARRVAFYDLPYLDVLGIEYALVIAEGFRQGALAGPPSAEQEELIWQASEGVYRAYNRGDFSDAQSFLGLNAWTGVTGFTGWSGLSTSLRRRPELRGPLAYLYGQRYLRLKLPADARTLFETALQDAKPDTPLHRLAKEALDKFPAGK